MAANAKSHYFHAEAHALIGNLTLPFEQQIKKQAFVKLEGTLAELSDAERAQRNYFSQHATDFRLEGIVSYDAAHTQVAGHASKKHPGASVTLATSVVENLNVLNVVTADRVVAQISTTHFPDQPTPSVTFLGTHFENLRIARHRAEPYLTMDMCQKPASPSAMHFDTGSGFIAVVEKQYNRVKSKLQGISAEEREKTRLEEREASLTKKYGSLGLDKGKIASDGRAAFDKFKSGQDVSWDGVTCSLVEHVEIKDISVKNGNGEMVHVPPPGPSFGHVIHVPDFGNIFLAELTVNHNSYHLTMIRLELGCLADGSMGLVSCNVNGKGHP